jgi:cytochrome c biogenesis protein CcdA
VLIIEDGLWEQTFNVAVNVVILLAFLKKIIMFFSPIIMGLLPKFSSRFSTNPDFLFLAT